MSEVEYRLARAGDREGVIKLWRGLIEFYGDSFRHYGSRTDMDILRNSFEKLLADERSRIIIAACEEEIIGTVTLLKQYSSWTGSYYGRIEDVFVAPEWRRQGIGESLLNFTYKIAEEENLSRLELHVLADNREAKGLYEKCNLVDNGSLVYTYMLEGSS